MAITKSRKGPYSPLEDQVAGDPLKERRIDGVDLRIARDAGGR